MPAEKIYLRLWREWNKVQLGNNLGLPAITHILNTRIVPEYPVGTDYSKLYDPVSQRDAAVAATIIEWLGSKEGSVFIAEAERRIAAQRKTDHHDADLKFNGGPMARSHLLELP